MKLLVSAQETISDDHDLWQAVGETVNKLAQRHILYAPFESSQHERHHREVGHACARADCYTISAHVLKREDQDKRISRLLPEILQFGQLSLYS